jgi:hypothetical protein
VIVVPFIVQRKRSPVALFRQKRSALPSPVKSATPWIDQFVSPTAATKFWLER